MKPITEDMVLSWHEHGYDNRYIARLLHLTEQEVEDTIKRKEKQ